MAVDPLSPATRATKRNLLAVSMLAITYRAFDVTIDKIPVAGLSIAFDNRVFAFLLIASLLYFTATFALYYYIDIRNAEKTPREKEREQSYQSMRNGFWSMHAANVFKRIQKRLPSDILINANQSGTLAHEFQEMEAAHFDPSTIPHLSPQVFQIFRRSGPGRPLGEPLRPDEHTDLYEIIGKTIDDSMAKYLRSRRRHSYRFTAFLFGTRALYFTRDYLMDGVLPLALALVAFAALFHLIGLQWLRDMMPMPPG